MTEPNHYHQRIQRATERLAQLQARELLASQRRESKARETAKREEAQRRARVAELVFLSGTQILEDEELLGVLLLHQERRDPDATGNAKKLGRARLHQQPPSPGKPQGCER